MRLVELAGDLDDVELRLLGKPFADGAGAAGVGPVSLRSTGRERRRCGPARGRRPRRRASIGAKLHLDGAVGQQRGLRRDRARRVEAAHVAPGHGVLIGGGVDEDAAVAGARVEIGEERRDARRTGQQARDVAIGAGAVRPRSKVMLPSELTNAVRLVRCRRTETRTARSPAALSSSVSVRRLPSVVAEPAVDATDVVAAGAVAGEAQADGCADRYDSEIRSGRPRPARRRSRRCRAPSRRLDGEAAMGDASRGPC